MKKDEHKTKKQLINELLELRQRIIEIETSETKCRRAEEALRESEEKFRTISASANDAIIMINNEGDILFMNKASEKIFGYSTQEIQGKELHKFLIPSKYFEAYQKGFSKFRITGQGPFIGKTLDLTALRKDGTEFPIELSVSAVKLKGKWNAIGIIRNISERKQMEEELKALSLRDELTGLYNRRGFITLAEQQLKFADRMGKRMLLLFADLDGMKYINDRFGHHEGDSALIVTGYILKEIFRKSDIIARIGGDEFVVLAMENHDATEKIYTDRLKKFLDNYNTKVNHGYKLMLSIGIAHYDPVSPCSIEQLVKRADKLMYEQKQQK